MCGPVFLCMCFCHHGLKLCISFEYVLWIDFYQVFHILNFVLLKHNTKSTLVKIPHCLKSHATAHIILFDSFTHMFKA